MLVGLFLLFRLLQFFAQVQLDRWWYDSVTDASVWSTMVGAKLLLALVAGGVTAILLGGTIALALRFHPVDRSELGALVRRYRDRMGPAHVWLLVAIVAFLTLRIGASATGQWQSWLLFRHGPELDQRVPELGTDLGYHLFDLPFLTTVSSWIRQLLLVALALTAFTYAMSGALRLPIDGRRSARPALAHLGLLVAAFAAAQALDYVFVRRPALATSTGGSFVGAGYTELNVGVPATWVLAVVALGAGFLLVDGARRGRWRLAVIALGCWAVLQLVLGVAAPWLVQRYVVAPAEAARELPYLSHNLDATRAAFRLDTVDQVETPLADGLGGDATAAAALAGDLSRIPLFDTEQLPGALQVLEGTTATRITDVDLDRYPIEGETRPVFVAPRNASRNDLPEQGWVQQHLVYTHGDGVVTAPADIPDPDGRPDVDALATTLVPERPELYFGEGLAGWYAIVGTKRVEQGGATFAADTGIPMSSLWRRAVLALSEGEIEPLLLGRADVGVPAAVPPRRRRAAAGAGPVPHLRATTRTRSCSTTGWSGSRRLHDVLVVPVLAVRRTSVASQNVNYVHGSVKATVDAYDGTVHLYRTAGAGADDPVLDAWDEIFPGLVEPISAMPADVAEHLRYPAALIQRPDRTARQVPRRRRRDPVQRHRPLDARRPRRAPASAKAGSGSAPAVSLFQPSGEPVARRALGGHGAVQPGHRAGRRARPATSWPHSPSPTTTTRR